MLGTFSPYRDHLLVLVDPETAYRTAGGVLLPEWQRGDRDPCYGTVLAAPQGVSRAGLGFPDLDGGRYTYADLTELPRVGDTVYFKYNTLKEELEHPEQAGVFLLALERVVAVVGPEGLRPFQGLLLGEPVWGDDVQVNLFTGRREQGTAAFVERDLPGGNTLQTTEFLVTEAAPLPLPFLLRVLHAGQPLRGQPDVVADGDVVSIHRMAYAYHAVQQDENEQATARWCWQAPSLPIGGRELIYVPRQLVLGTVRF